MFQIKLFWKWDVVIFFQSSEYLAPKANCHCGLFFLIEIWCLAVHTHRSGDQIVTWFLELVAKQYHMTVDCGRSFWGWNLAPLDFCDFSWQNSPLNSLHHNNNNTLFFHFHLFAEALIYWRWKLAAFGDSCSRSNVATGKSCTANIFSVGRSSELNKVPHMKGKAQNQKEKASQWAPAEIAWDKTVCQDSCVTSRMAPFFMKPHWLAAMFSPPHSRT